jgi:hypothetical protein
MMRDGQYLLPIILIPILRHVYSCRKLYYHVPNICSNYESFSRYVHVWSRSLKNKQYLSPFLRIKAAKQYSYCPPKPNQMQIIFHTLLLLLLLLPILVTAVAEFIATV